MEKEEEIDLDKVYNLILCGINLLDGEHKEYIHFYRTIVDLLSDKEIEEFSNKYEGFYYWVNLKNTNWKPIFKEVKEEAFLEWNFTDFVQTLKTLNAKSKFMICLKLFYFHIHLDRANGLTSKRIPDITKNVANIARSFNSGSEALHFMKGVFSFVMSYRYELGFKVKELIQFTVMHLVPILDVIVSYIANDPLLFDPILNILCENLVNSSDSLKVNYFNALKGIKKNFPDRFSKSQQTLVEWNLGPELLLDTFIKDQTKLTRASEILNLFYEPSHEPIKLKDRSLEYGDQNLISSPSSLNWLTKIPESDRENFFKAFRSLLINFINDYNYYLSSSRLCPILNTIIFTHFVYGYELEVNCEELFDKLNLSKINQDGCLRYYDLVLCFIFLFYNASKHKKSNLYCLIEWLNQVYFEGTARIILAVRNKENGLVNTFISSVLGFKVSLETEKIENMDRLFKFRDTLSNQYLFNQLITDYKINYDLIKQTVIERDIIRRLGYYYDISLKLLAYKEFSILDYDLKAWITGLIDNLDDLPIHPKLPKLIKEYIDRLFRLSFKNIKKIDQDFIYSYLKPTLPNCFKSLSSKNILLFYYLLLFDEKIMRCCDNSPDLAKELMYSDEIMDLIAAKNQIKFSDKYLVDPILDEFKMELKALTNYKFPQYFGVIELSMSHYNNISNHSYNSHIPYISEIKKRVKNPLPNNLNSMISTILFHVKDDIILLKLVLNFIKNLEVEKIIGLTQEILSILPIFFNLEEQDEEALTLFYDIWMTINEFLPETLWPLTISSSINLSSNNVPSRVLSMQNLVEDLSCLFLFHDKMFKIPILLKITLLIFEGVRIAFNLKLKRNYKFAKRYFDDDVIKERVIKEFIPLKRLDDEIRFVNSILVQYLIEICSNEFNYDNEDNIEDVRKSALAFIQRLFIEDGELIYLVHKQAYNLDAIPYMVKYVPSMFYLRLKFSELTDADDRFKSWFLIEIFYHLIEKYPVLEFEEPLVAIIRVVLSAFIIDRATLNTIENEEQLYSAAIKKNPNCGMALIEDEVIKYKQILKYVSDKRINQVIRAILKVFPNQAAFFIQQFKEAAKPKVWFELKELLSLFNNTLNGLIAS